MSYKLQAITLWPEWLPMFFLPERRGPECLEPECSAKAYTDACRMRQGSGENAASCSSFRLDPPRPKRVENRDWEAARIPHHVVGRWLAFHAGKDIGGAKAGKKGQEAALDAVAEVAEAAGWPLHIILEATRPENLIRSAIVALMRIDAINTQPSPDPWAFDPPAWQLVIGEVRQIEPVPCQGSQGIWAVSEQIRRAVLAECAKHPEWKW